jgi:hypothetical protein
MYFFIVSTSFRQVYVIYSKYNKSLCNLFTTKYSPNNLYNSSLIYNKGRKLLPIFEHILRTRFSIYLQIHRTIYGHKQSVRQKDRTERHKPVQNMSFDKFSTSFRQVFFLYSKYNNSLCNVLPQNILPTIFIIPL